MTAAQVSPAPQEALSPALQALPHPSGALYLAFCTGLSVKHVSPRLSEAFCLEYFLSNDLVSGHFELIGNKLCRMDHRGGHLSY